MPYVISLITIWTQCASTGNEQALSGLPDRERDAARQIAATIKGKGNEVARD
jgi:hypothetical protein